MAKGDRIRVAATIAGNPVELLEVTASQNGRKVAVEHDAKNKTVEITETTRGGTVVRRVWLPASSIVFIDQEVREE